MADLDDPPRRIEAANQVVVFFEDRIELVSQAQVNDDFRRNPPIILKEGGVSLIAQLTEGIAY